LSNEQLNAQLIFTIIMNNITCKSIWQIES